MKYVFAVGATRNELDAEERKVFFGFFITAEEAEKFVETAGKPRYVSAFDERLFIEEMSVDMAGGLGLYANPRQVWLRKSGDYATYY